MLETSVKRVVRGLNHVWTDILIALRFYNEEGAGRAIIPCLPEHPSLVHFLFRTLPSDFIYLPASRRILEIIL